MERWTTTAQLTWVVFSPSLSQGMTGGHGLGVICGQIKALASFFSHIKEVSVLKACRANMYTGENTEWSHTQYTVSNPSTRTLLSMFIA